MPKLSDRTDMGGANRVFQTTNWSHIRQLHTLDPASRRQMLGQIMLEYWQPIYSFLRCKGFDDATSKDLTQGFFIDSALRRGLVHKADPGKGRFRTYLLHALRNYVKSHCRHENAQKRAFGRTISLSQGAARGIFVADGITPEDAFAFAWAQKILHSVIVQVEQYCRSEGFTTHWELFSRRVLNPICRRTRAPGIPELCQEFGIAGEGTVSNMIMTVKRRFQHMFRKEVASMLEDPNDLDQEIAEIMQILSRNAARK